MAEIAVRMTVMLHGDERATVYWDDRERVEFPVRVTIVDREGDGGELVDLMWDSRLGFLGFIQQLARQYDALVRGLETIALRRSYGVAELQKLAREALGW